MDQRTGGVPVDPPLPHTRTHARTGWLGVLIHCTPPPHPSRTHHTRTHARTRTRTRTLPPGTPPHTHTHWLQHTHTPSHTASTILSLLCRTRTLKPYMLYRRAQQHPHCPSIAPHSHACPHALKHNATACACSTPCPPLPPVESNNRASQPRTVFQTPHPTILGSGGRFWHRRWVGRSVLGVDVERLALCLTAVGEPVPRRSYLKELAGDHSAAQRELFGGFLWSRGINSCTVRGQTSN
jgi:hypothetical protein